MIEVNKRLEWIPTGVNLEINEQYAKRWFNNQKQIKKPLKHCVFIVFSVFTSPQTAQLGFLYFFMFFTYKIR